MMFSILFLLMDLTIRVFGNNVTTHGGEVDSFKKREHKVECPYNGAITAIVIRYGGYAYKGSRGDFYEFILQISFICTSSIGKTTFGPYGDDNGPTPVNISCPEGQYISSFFGKSGTRLNRIGVRCRGKGDMVSSGRASESWGDEVDEWLVDGSPFDDLSCSIGSRPVSVSVQVIETVLGIQVTYGNTPLTDLCSHCDGHTEEWAPVVADASNQGPASVRKWYDVMYSFACPNEGAITGIKYASLVHERQIRSITFYCTSHTGETTFGPYGNGVYSKEGEQEKKCLENEYVSSIYGEYSAFGITELNIRCKSSVPNSQDRNNTQNELRLKEFDHINFELRNLRPVAVRIWATYFLYGFQIKYGSMPVANNCKVTKIEVLDKPKNLHDGFEIVGIVSGVACSSSQQTLSLNKVSGKEESVGVDTMDGGQFDFSTEWSFSFETGVSFIGTAQFTWGGSVSAGYSKSWSTTATRSTTYTSGTESSFQSNFEGPGAGLLIGYLDTYRIDQDNVTARYQFLCDGGYFPSYYIGKLKYSSKLFGKVNFQSFQIKLNNTTQCTAEARTCVKALETQSYIFDFKKIQSRLDACFDFL